MQQETCSGRQMYQDDPGCCMIAQLWSLTHCPCVRLEAHKGILEAASTALLARIGVLDTDKLLDLLEASFPLVGISALRTIPLAILGRLQPVPISYLKQLADDKDLFQDLPRGVQRQVLTPAWSKDTVPCSAESHVASCACLHVQCSLLNACEISSWQSKQDHTMTLGGGEVPALRPFLVHCACFSGPAAGWPALAIC